MESRFHRVTPYAAWRLRMLFILDVSREVVWSKVEQTTKWYHNASRREAPRHRSGRRKQIEKKYFFGLTVPKY
jgi:hypothetical protein